MEVAGCSPRTAGSRAVKIGERVCALEMPSRRDVQGSGVAARARTKT
jgi:hypothetical protein